MSFVVLGVICSLVELVDAVTESQKKKKAGGFLPLVDINCAFLFTYVSFFVFFFALRVMNAAK